MGDKTLKEKTATGLLWGGISNTIQQVLSLFFGIFLARILNAEEYGMVGMLTIFSLIANSIQESGFTSALAIKSEVKHNDFNAVFWFSLLMGGVLYALLFFLAPFIAKFYRLPELVPLARFIFLGFLFSSMGTAQSAYLFRHLMVKKKAQAQIIGLAVSGTLAVILALNGLSYWSIAIQGVVYVAVVTFMLWVFSPWRPDWSINFEPIKKMYGFSIKVLVTNLFNHLNNNVLTVLLGKFFTPIQVGDYTQASKWNTMSSNVIINMINGVAQPVLAEAAEEKERHKRVFRKMVKFTAFLSFPAMFGLAIIAQEFIVLTITAKWLPSVPLLQVLCVGGGFAPIVYLYTHLIISKGKSNIYMWNVIVLGLLQILLMLSLSSFGILIMVIGFVSLNILWLIVWHYFVQREISYSLKEVLVDIVSFALISLVIMVFVYHLMSGVESMLLRLILKVVISAVLYALVMLFFQRNLIIETIRMIFKIKNK